MKSISVIQINQEKVICRVIQMFKGRDLSQLSKGGRGTETIFGPMLHFSTVDGGSTPPPTPRICPKSVVIYTIKLLAFFSSKLDFINSTGNAGNFSQYVIFIFIHFIKTFIKNMKTYLSLNNIHCIFLFKIAMERKTKIIILIMIIIIIKKEIITK